MSRKKRLRKIQKVLLEMGAGNFFYRIKRSSKTDAVEALISSMNMIGEEVEEVLVHQGYVNAHSTIKHIVLMNFMIDSNGKIQALNQQASTILFFSKEDMIGRSFESFLDEGYLLKWKEHMAHFKDKKIGDAVLDLSFRTKHGLLVPSACYLNILEGKDGCKEKLLITVVKHSRKQVELDSNFLSQKKRPSKSAYPALSNYPKTPSKQKVRLTNEDIQKISQARDLMLNNLERDFPSIKDFALEIGTNTFKLKYGFKELYGVSVFRFLRNERLRKAKMLVQYGDRPFKTIAHLCGFKSVPHFTRIFKEQFGLTPTQLREISKSEDN